jgi:hypothetical protein
VLGREARLLRAFSGKVVTGFPSENATTLVFLWKDHAPVQGLHLLSLGETLKQLLDFKQDISFVWIGLALGLPASFIGVGNAFLYLQSWDSYADVNLAE